MSVEGTSVEAPVLDVAAFYEVVTAHLEAAFGRRRPLWVRGEVAKVYEKGHVYLDLVDGGSDTADTRRPVLNAHCWSRQWGPLKARLAADGVTLAPGMTVTLYGYVDVYAPQGKIGFSVLDVDVTSLLGELARRRQELIGRLRAEGLLEANARHPVPAVPLRVGVVASPATEGFRDFAGVLEGSGFAFALEVVASLVQGEGAPPQIVAALESLAARAPDVICVVRGGGSRGDLACFDDESVARAIAHCPVPVFTGIGHTGDESVADLVAHTRAITPTKLGEILVERVRTWREERLRRPAARVRERAGDLLDEADAYVAERRRAVVFGVRDRIRAEERHLASTRQRLVVDARRTLEGARGRLGHHRALLAAYDPARRLAQGWSIVTDASGRVVRDVDAVSVGDEVTVRVATGSFGARVQTVGEG
ncbi:MAG: exodeoxyribonuclease VII large subunit [Actinobacteria bacterium 21-73-9]|nr:MAG: exodeoxyribonuclease VII large subunit [Actinobacteria bacterium 21-73-9]